ncbi:MAG: tetratricopeptide repeat protein [bacterium]
MRDSPDTRAGVEQILQEALRLGEEDAWEEMADHLRAALEEDPGNPYFLCWLGVAEREMGLDMMAYDHFKECLAQQPDDPHVLATAGNGVAAFDDPDAEAALRTAAVMAPELSLARWMYGAYLSREGMAEKALEELEAARDLDPENPTILYELGVALLLDDALDAAVDVLDESIRLGPDDGWARVVLGLILLRSGRDEEALRDLAEGARHRPEDVKAQLLAALAAASRGHLDLAHEMLERARQRAEGVAEATVLEVEERIDAGEEAAERFLEETLAPSALRERLMARP